MLGWIAEARGLPAEAEAQLGEALKIFTVIHARFEAARTHLALARLAHRRDARSAASHLGHARRLFADLGMPPDLAPDAGTPRRRSRAGSGSGSRDHAASPAAGPARSGRRR